jgi:hypothetical protein
MKQASWGSFWYWALLEGHNGNDIQQDLRFLHEQFDDRQPVGPVDRYCDELALRLALGPPIEVAFSEFWHTILYWGGLKKYDIPVPRPFTDLSTRYNPEDMHGPYVTGRIPTMRGSIYPFLHSRLSSSSSRMVRRP